MPNQHLTEHSVVLGNNISRKTVDTMRNQHFNQSHPRNCLEPQLFDFLMETQIFQVGGDTTKQKHQKNDSSDTAKENVVICNSNIYKIHSATFYYGGWELATFFHANYSRN